MTNKKAHQKAETNVSAEMELMFARLFAASEFPSKHMASAWLYAQDPDLKSFGSSEQSGKWCVFRSGVDVDETWVKIKKACEKKELSVAKVASAMSGKRFGGNHVICVYTSDYKDKKEVDRVRKVLFDLGCIEPLAYKRDIDTINGVYGTKEEWYYTDEGFLSQSELKASSKPKRQKIEKSKRVG
jgi:Domain of unknown function (DUF1917)